MLQGAGLPGVSFGSPSEVLEAISSGSLDLVILDVMQAGADVMKVLRACVGANGSSPVAVMVTAPAAAADRVQACLQHGAEDYIHTPLDTKNALLVTRRIEYCLRRREPAAEKGRGKAGDDTAVVQLLTDASSRFVPREFLQHLARKSLNEVRLGDHVQKTMSVLFSDIRDFTKLSEALTPQQNFNFLNSYLRNVNPIIRTHRGFIDKYIGDAIMALFPETPMDALQAAVELQQAVVKYNEGRRAAGYVPISIGIGIHRGELILGTIGEDARMQTTVIADAVDTAAHLEELTKMFGVSLLISGAVVAGLDKTHPFLLRHLGAVKAKGKSRSVEIYECFNNDPPELIEHKQKNAETFEEAIGQYMAGDYMSAGKGFGKIAALCADDTPAVHYRDSSSLTVIRDRHGGSS